MMTKSEKPKFEEKNPSALCEILGICPDTVAAFALQGRCAVLIGSLLQTTNHRRAKSHKSGMMTCPCRFTRKKPHKNKKQPEPATAKLRRPISFRRPPPPQFSKGAKVLATIARTTPALLKAIQRYEV
jgi:hypothetical protein